MAYSNGNHLLLLWYQVSEGKHYHIRIMWFKVLNSTVTSKSSSSLCYDRWWRILCARGHCQETNLSSVLLLHEVSNWLVFSEWLPWNCAFGIPFQQQVQKETGKLECLRSGMSSFRASSTALKSDQVFYISAIIVDAYIESCFWSWSCLLMIDIKGGEIWFGATLKSYLSRHTIYSRIFCMHACSHARCMAAIR